MQVLQSLIALLGLVQGEERAYIISLLLCTLLAPVLRLLPTSSRPFFSILIGLSHYWFFCRGQIICLAIPFGLCCFCVCSSAPKYTAYVFTFGSLCLFRALNTTAIIHIRPLTNTCLLLYTLRLVDFVVYAYDDVQSIYKERRTPKSGSVSGSQASDGTNSAGEASLEGKKTPPTAFVRPSFSRKGDKRVSARKQPVDFSARDGTDSRDREIVSESPRIRHGELQEQSRVQDYSRGSDHSRVQDYSRAQDYSRVQDYSRIHDVALRFQVFAFFLSYAAFFPGLWAGPVVPPGQILHALWRKPRFEFGKVISTSNPVKQPEIAHESVIPAAEPQIDTRNNGKISSNKRNQSTEKLLDLHKEASETTSQKETLSQKGEADHMNGHRGFRRTAEMTEGAEVLMLMTMRSLETLPSAVAVILSYAGILPNVPASTESNILWINHNSHSPLRFLMLPAWIQRYIMLALRLVVYRAKFYAAWLFGEFAVVLAGVRSDETIEILDLLGDISNVTNSQAERDRRNDSPRAAVVSSRHPTFLKDTIEASMQGIYGISASENLELKITTLRSCDVAGVELAPSLQCVVRSWNMTIQAFFVRAVYKQYRPRNRTLRRLAVFGLSALWHGFHPGYFMAFAAVFLFEKATVMTRPLLDLCFPVRSGSEGAAAAALPEWRRSSSLASWIGQVIVTNMLLTFAMVPFVCLEATESIEIWRELSFYGFPLAFALFSAGLVLDSESHYTKKDKPVVPAQ